MKGESGARHAARAITVDNPSLDQSELHLGYRLGYGAGYKIGFAHGWNQCDDELQALFGLYHEVLTQPRQAALDAARRPTNDPCRLECGRCSRCVRARAVAARLDAGQPADYAGTGAP